MILINKVDILQFQGLIKDEMNIAVHHLILGKKELLHRNSISLLFPRIHTFCKTQLY